MDALEQYYNLDNVQVTFPQKITAIRCGEDVYYLKRRIEDKYWSKKALRFVQKGLVSILGLRELAPTANVRRASSYEPRKILELEQRGVSVPKVYYYNDQYFIMSDCGMTLQSYLNHYPDEAGPLLIQAMRQLAILHNAGNAHGGSQARNFAVKDGRVTLFDFEEIIPERYCENIQFRDILIFLISLSRLKKLKIDYRALLHAYEEVAVRKGRTQKVVALARKFRWLGNLSQTRMAKLFGRDVYRLSQFVRAISMAEAEKPLV